MAAQKTDWSLEQIESENGLQSCVWAELGWEQYEQNNNRMRDPGDPKIQIIS